MPVHSVRDTQMLLQTKSMSKRLRGGRKKITTQPTKLCWKTQDVDTSAYMVTTRTMYLCEGNMTVCLCACICLGTSAPLRCFDAIQNCLDPTVCCYDALTWSRIVWIPLFVVKMLWHNADWPWQCAIVCCWGALTQRIECCVLQCFRRYTTAQVLLHSLAQLARNDQDKLLLEKCECSRMPISAYNLLAAISAADLPRYKRHGWLGVKNQLSISG